MPTNHDQEINAFLNDFAVPRWAKIMLKKAMIYDPVDAANLMEKVADLLGKRARRIIEEARINDA